MTLYSEVTLFKIVILGVGEHMMCFGGWMTYDAFFNDGSPYGSYTISCNSDVLLLRW